MIGYLKYSFTIVSLLTINFISNAQVTVNSAVDVQTLIQEHLVGPGVTVSNITTNGIPTQRYGTFNGTNTNMGIANGITLATKNIALSHCGSTNNGSGNNTDDPDLKQIVNAAQRDVTIIEFDFVTNGDEIEFTFVFASREYDSYVGSNFNDVFGFFLSGPGINGTFSNNAVNIARLPNGAPVTINTVNAGQNNAYYVANGDNTGSNGPPFLCFGGYTTPITVNYTIQCGQTYHLKIALANIIDTQRDSQVFFEQGSFSAIILDPTITAPSLVCHDVAPIQFTAGTAGGTWAGPGINASGIFDPAIAGIGSHTITYSTGVAPCEESDEHIIEVENCDCNFTDLTVNTNLPACEQEWQVTGSTAFNKPPTTGNLVFEDCKGNTTVIASAPFTSPVNFTHNGLLGDLTGGDCDFTVYFSDDLACELTTTINLPAYTPQDDAGTVTSNMTGDGTTNYILCDGDVLNVNTNSNSTINPIAPGNDPSVVYYLYNCPPSPGGPGIVPSNNPCFVGVVNNANATFTNNGGDNDGFLTSLGVNAGDQLYIVPMTHGSLSGNTYSPNCYDLAIDETVITTYLNPITTTIVEDCQNASTNVTISGGHAEFFGTNYTLSNLQPASASLSTTSSTHGQTVTISNLADGDNYSFDIIDANGCPQNISGTFKGLDVASFTYPKNSYCSDENNPIATITGTLGGTFTVAPEGLTIVPNSGEIDISSATGDFTITYTTPDPVCFATQNWNITINPQPTVTPINDVTICDNYTLPAIAGTNIPANARYFTQPNGAGQNFAPGTTLIHTDFATYPITLYAYAETGTTPNCWDEESFELTINPTPQITPLTDVEQCDNYTLPAITGTNLTGNENYYTQAGGNGSSVPANSVLTDEGTTTYYIYDETSTTPNCFDETNFTVTINLTPQIDPISDNAFCDEFTFPAITGTNLTGNEAYYTAANGTGTSYSPTNVYTTEGTTVFYIYDATNTPSCFDEESFEVSIFYTPEINPLADIEACDESTLPTITGTNLTSAIACYDQPNGNGNTYPLNHIVNTPGTTTFYVYDESSATPHCYDEISFDVTIRLTPSINPINDQLVCDEYELPQITGTNLTGDEMYFSQANGGGTSFSSGTIITDIGTQTFYIYDETGGTPNCLDEQLFELTLGTTPVFTVSAVNPTGCGTNDGQIIIEGLAPTTTYTVSYETNSTTVGPFDLTTDMNGLIEITALAPGAYINVRVDNEHCWDIDNTPLNLIEPDAPFVNAGDNQTVCEGTSVTLVAENPEDVIITWNNNVEDGVPFIQESGTTNYTVTADFNNCLSFDQVTVTVLAQPIIDQPNDTSACDNFALLPISGTNLTPNVSYYDAPNGTGNSLAVGEIINTPGNNTVYIFDEIGTDLGCSDEKIVNITINQTPALVTPSNEVVCDSYTLLEIEGTNLTSNAKYSSEPLGAGTIYPAGTTLTNAGQTEVYLYDETQTNPNCTSETSFTITILPTPQITPVQNTTICDTYTFPEILGNNLTNDVAYFTEENGAGTPYSVGDVYTTIGTTTFYIYDESTNPTCIDQTSFNVTINQTPIISPFTSIEACMSTELPPITGEYLNNTIYYSNSNLTGTTYQPGDNYIITGNTALFAYSETSTTPNCSDTVALNILIHTQPSFSVSLDNPSLCDVANGTITIEGLEPNTEYTINYEENGINTGNSQVTTTNDGEIILPNLGAGTYENFTIDKDNCPATSNVTYTLTDPDLPYVNAGLEQELCDGDSVLLIATNPENAVISWSNSIVDNLAFYQNIGEVTYTVTAELNNCFATDSVTVFVAPNPTVFAGNNITVCEGGQVILTASGADTYEWNNNVINGIPFSPTIDGTYIVTGVTQYGCTDTDSLSVIIEYTPEVNFEGDSLYGCIPHTVNFSNNSIPSGYDCTWHLGDGTVINTCDDISHTYSLVGCFDVRLVVRTAGGCASTIMYEDYICVGGNPTANFTFNPNEPTTVFTEVEFENLSTGATSYEWFFGDGNTSEEEHPTHNYQEIERDYLVTLIATSNNGCSDIVIKPLRVVESLVFYVPNTFTPTGDGINDIFKPEFTSGFDPQNYRLLIFNRWGEVLFESQNSDVGWDGSYGIDRNEKVKEGTYIWTIEYLVKGEEDTRTVTGHVNLLK